MESSTEAMQQIYQTHASKGRGYNSKKKFSATMHNGGFHQILSIVTLLHNTN